MTSLIDEFKKGLLLEPSTPEVIVRGHTAVRRDLIAERAKFTSYDPDLIPTKRKWPVMLRITTLVITFCSKIFKKLGKKFRGKLLSPCSVKLYLTVAEKSRINGSEDETKIVLVTTNDENKEKTRSYLHAC